MEGDGITGKRREGSLEEGGSSAKRLKCSIEPEAFSCDACGRPLWLPIFLVNRSSTILRCVCIDLEANFPARVLYPPHPLSQNEKKNTR